MTIIQPRHASLLALVGALALLVFAPSAGATSPGKNGLITFAADTGNGNQLYTVRPNGHDLRQITNVAGEASLPDWSPDGRHIVFQHDWNTEARCATVDVINPDGSNDVSLTSGVGGCEGDPSYTPDGSRIVYARFDFATLDNPILGMRADG